MGNKKIKIVCYKIWRGNSEHSDIDELQMGKPESIGSWENLMGSLL